MSVRRTFRAAILIALSRIGPGHGVDWKGIRERLAIPPDLLIDPQSRVSATLMAEAMSLAAAQSGKPEIALLAGEAVEHVVGSPIVQQMMFAVRVQPTLAEAIRYHARIAQLQTDSISYETEEDGPFIISKRYLTSRAIAGNPFLIDGAFALALPFWRTMLGRDWKPELTCFARPQPADDSAYRRVFGKVEWGHDFDGWVFDTRSAYHPLPAPDPESMAEIERLIDDRVARDGPGSDDIATVAVRLLTEGDCSLYRLAEELGVDRRTVHRRLQVRGLTYSELLDQARREIVEQQIRRDDLVLSDLAEMLGFSAVSTFSRWFRQAYGVSATDYRRRRMGSTETDRQATLMGRTRDIVLGVGPAGTILFSNPAAARFGYDAGLIGGSLDGLVHPSDAAPLVEGLARAWSGDPGPAGSPAGQARFRGGDGRHARCDYNFAPIFGRGGELSEVLVIVHPLV
jgi:AraC-like DNA-binding protein